jgi:hypothetical protein
VINLAVQEALKTLKAVPAEQIEAYRMVYQSAILLYELEKNNVISVLYKLRRHIYIFQNRRVWRTALEKQCKAANIKYQSLSLDMPVRWNSTYNMIKGACKLQIPITAVCTIQDYDISVRALMITPYDWSILDNIQKLFAIFVRPS